jgi:hypothetical protein
MPRELLQGHVPPQRRRPGGSLHLADDASDFNPNGYCVTSNGNVSPGSPVVEHARNFGLNQFWSGPIGVLG